MTKILHSAHHEQNTDSYQFLTKPVSWAQVFLPSLKACNLSAKWSWMPFTVFRKLRVTLGVSPRCFRTEGLLLANTLHIDDVFSSPRRWRVSLEMLKAPLTGEPRVKDDVSVTSAAHAERRWIQVTRACEDDVAGGRKRCRSCLVYFVVIEFNLSQLIRILLVTTESSVSIHFALD